MGESSRTMSLHMILIQSGVPVSHCFSGVLQQLCQVSSSNDLRVSPNPPSLTHLTFTIHLFSTWPWYHSPSTPYCIPLYQYTIHSLSPTLAILSSIHPLSFTLSCVFHRFILFWLLICSCSCFCFLVLFISMHALLLACICLSTYSACCILCSVVIHLILYTFSFSWTAMSTLKEHHVMDCLQAMRSTSRLMCERHAPAGKACRQRRFRFTRWASLNLWWSRSS